MEIKDRIIEFLKAENISSANFAQEIGVQPSGISHIFSGRNKPSLDFIVKMLNRYPSLSTEWLMFGKGKMLRDNLPGDLFNNEPYSENHKQDHADIFEVTGTAETSTFKEKFSEGEKGNRQAPEHLISGGKAVRIVIFFKDNTFTEYFPG